MQGVLIASGVAAVRKSLAAIVGEGRTVHECGSISEALALAAAQKMDYIFIDDLFRDGDAEELVSRLHGLHYGVELVPLLLSRERRYLLPFHKYGIKFAITKPFEIQQVRRVLEQIQDLTQDNANNAQQAQNLLAELKSRMQIDAPEMHEESWHNGQQFDIREISQRFRRLVVRSLKRTDLIPAFAECLQEQFDVDNVVILLPAREAPCFRIAWGQVHDAVREQFYLPLGEPFLASLIRLEAPVWLDNCDCLGHDNCIAAMRCGERLGVRVLCPITSRGRMLAVVGLSRIHRYHNRSFLISLLRLFFTFFAKALENADLHGQVAAAEETYRTIFDVLPLGAVAVAADGSIRSLNPLAASMLGAEIEELQDQPVEKAGSLLADAAREVLSTGEDGENRTVLVRGKSIKLSAVPLGEEASGGVLVLLNEESLAAQATADVKEAFDSAELMNNMSKVLAHNFKNALVPVKTCAELLPERYENEGFRASFFEVVQDSINRIDRWIDKLLRFSVGPVGENRRSRFPLHDAVECGLERAVKQFPHLDVVVTRDYCDDDEVNNNRGAVEEIFYELITNALDAVQDISEPGLRIEIQPEGDDIYTRIIDNGPGFPEEDKNMLGKPFHTRKLHGLGLGLAFVKKTLELCNGRIDIESGHAKGGRVVVALAPARKLEKTPVSAAKEAHNT